MAIFTESNFDELKITDKLLINNTNILELMYPIGSVYTTANNVTTCPLYTLGIGKEWELIQNKFLLPSTAYGNTGGIPYKILPEHDHYFSIGWSGDHYHGFAHFHVARLWYHGEDVWAGSDTDYLWAKGHPSDVGVGTTGTHRFSLHQVANLSGEDGGHSHSLSVGNVDYSTATIIDDLGKNDDHNLPPFYTVRSWIRKR